MNRRVLSGSIDCSEHDNEPTDSVDCCEHDNATCSIDCCEDDN
jgi:hypothetical protein